MASHRVQRLKVYERGYRYVGPDRDELAKAEIEWEAELEQRGIERSDRLSLDALEDVEIPPSAFDAPRTYGVVYFVQAESGGPVKIGCSSYGQIHRRLRSFQNGNPEPLALRRLVKGDLGLERWLHKELSADHLRGEWFNPSDRVREVSRAV